MATLADILRINDLSVVEEVPGMVWCLMANEPEKEQQARQRNWFGFLKRRDKKGSAESGEKKFACWTCGASYGIHESRDFLAHIRECCKDESSSKTKGI